MTEQRKEQRRTLSDTQIAVVDVESGVEFAGRGADVSASGLSFDAQMEPPVGADMLVTLTGDDNRRARLEVTRVQPTAQGFQVAGRWL